MSRFNLIAVKLIASLCVFMVLSTSLWAGIEVKSFDDPKQQEIYDRLTYELRCLVCQNENIASSNADLAKDLRDEVYLMIVDKGMSEQEIKDFVVERYGDFVLYRPPVKKSTWLLWGGPFIMLLIGLIVMFFVIRSNRQSLPEQTMDDKERDNIRDLLNNQSDTK